MSIDGKLVDKSFGIWVAGNFYKSNKNDDELPQIQQNSSESQKQHQNSLK